MLKKTITYIDYNDVERTEDFYFNLSKAEITDMELGTTGGLSEKLKKIVETKDQPQIIRMFKEIILASYGVKSDDGRRFIKSPELATEFSQTEAYSELYMELATDAQKAADFINGIVPKEGRIDAEKQKAIIEGGAAK